MAEGIMFNDHLRVRLVFEAVIDDDDAIRLKGFAAGGFIRSDKSKLVLVFEAVGTDPRGDAWAYMNDLWKGHHGEEVAVRFERLKP